MHRRIVLFLIVCGTVATLGNASEDRPTRIAIVNVGGLDSHLFERVVDHIRTHLGTEPLVLPPVGSCQADDLAGEAASLAPLLTDGSLLVVGLVMPESSIDKHGFVDPELRVGILNARALRPDDGDPERYARRLEKETLRAIGLLLGLKPVPIPFSAMYPYENEKMLDAKGRTFDPPSLMEFRRVARRLHLQGYTD